jgi:hypothetical protein
MISSRISFIVSPGEAVDFSERARRKLTNGSPRSQYRGKLKDLPSLEFPKWDLRDVFLLSDAFSGLRCGIVRIEYPKIERGLSRAAFLFGGRFL